MKYEILTKEDARRFLDDLNQGGEPNIADFTTQRGDGPPLELTGLNLVARDIAKVQSNDEEPESTEQRFSGSVYTALRDIPVEVRDDIGFWRYATLGPLRKFFEIRGEPTKRMELAGTGQNVQDTLALRMFLRGQVSIVSKKGSDDFSLAEAPGLLSHDFWQSHILRVPTGAQNSIAQALIRAQSKYHLVTTPHLRDFVRDYINRPKRLLAAELFSADEGEVYLNEQISRYLGAHPDALSKKAKSERKRAKN